MIKLKIKTLLITFIVTILVLLFILWSNNSIVVSNHFYYSPYIPIHFNNYKIVQISDLHSATFGKNNNSLLSKIESLEPDMIVITGDLIDSRRFNLDTAMDFISNVLYIAPTYYVSGNHEVRSGHYSYIIQELLKAGVVVLENDSIEILKENSSLKLIGLSDPMLNGVDDLKQQLEQFSDSYKFKILLSHRPELFDIYYDNNINLIFSGHAHGGQVRLPIIGGLAAPHQGLFPKYDSGMYNQGISTMFVSRGLGNSIFPIRLFNRPEIIFVTMTHDNSF